MMPYDIKFGKLKVLKKNLKYFFITFNFENDLSAVATVTGSVKNIVQATKMSE